MQNKTKHTNFFRFSKGRLNILLVYLHRYLRLTPLLGMGFLFSMSLMRFLGSGPFWPNIVKTQSEQCDKYWWSALLYAQNYVNPKEIVSFFFLLWFFLSILIFNFVLVFRTFLVSFSWFSTVSHRSVACLLDLFFQRDSYVYHVICSFGLHWRNFVCLHRKWLERVVSIFSWYFCCKLVLTAINWKFRKKKIQLEWVNWTF